MNMEGKQMPLEISKRHGLLLDESPNFAVLREMGAPTRVVSVLDQVRRNLAAWLQA